MDTSNTYNLLQIQKDLLKLILQFDDFASSHNVTYSLAYGSLLGAVRHQGFIPWDDDLDIIVDRANYRKLLDAFHDDNILIVEQDLWINRIRAKKSNNFFVPTIDIFVFDRIPSKNIVSFLKKFSLRIIQGMMKRKLRLSGFSFFYKLALILTYIIGRLFPNSFLFFCYDKISQIGNKTICNSLCVYNSDFADLNLRFSSDIIEKVIKVPFEGNLLPCMAKYDEFLRIQYGDYMTPPSKEECKPQHVDF